MDLTVLKRSPIAHLCFAITFFTSGLIVNLVQAVFYVGLRPFNKALYRKINYYLCYTLYSRKYILFTGRLVSKILLSRAGLCCGMVGKCRFTVIH